MDRMNVTSECSLTRDYVMNVKHSDKVVKQKRRRRKRRRRESKKRKGIEF